MAAPNRVLQFPQDLAARIRAAILNRRLITVTYHGRPRRAEPHDYGRLNEVDRLLVYQFDPAGWRMLDVPKIEALVMLDEGFPGSRQDEYQSHHRWDAIYARVE
jgi:hypothetical protein